MRVNGDWLICEDGLVRPIVLGLVRASDGEMVEVTFLLDAGADRTVLSADFLSLLSRLQTSDNRRIQLAGVGGQVDCITVDTVVGFTRDDGRVVTVNGPFSAFTNR